MISPNAKRFIALIVITAAIVVGMFRRPAPLHTHTGSTMGTTFAVSWVMPDSPIEDPDIRQKIDLLLEEVNNLMSTYIPTSELSRFNQTQTDTWFPV